LGAFAVRAGRPHAVVMVGLGVRLMLDPGVHHYYTAGLVLGVLMWELGRRPDRLPWGTAVTAVGLEMSSSALHPAEFAGALRLLVTSAVVVAACVMGDPVAVPATPVHASVAGSMGDP
ncbi:MAG: hypothetical protein JWL70_1213, partial [Acidimicrobiia bacterium]|nr:hypothetical protein [Acidimicrobiia bacterium]